MNKFTYLFFFLCYFSFSTNAQVVSFTEEIILRTEVGYEIIGELMGNTLLFKERANELEVEAFSEKMRSIWSKKLKLDRKNGKVLGIISQNTSFVLFYRYKIKGDLIVKAHKYDPGANLVDSIVVKNFGRQFVTPKFNFAVSENEKKLLVYFIDNQRTVNSVVFDIDSFKMDWEKKFEIEDYSYIRDDLFFLTNNEGDLILIVEKDNVQGRRDDHVFQIFQLIDKGQASKSYTIPMANLLTFDLDFRYDNLNKNITIAGLFSEKNIARANGYFSLFVPDDINEQYSLVFRKFDEELLSNLSGKNTPDNRGLMECQVEDLILRSDGGVILIGEMNREFERRLAGSGRVVMDSYNRFIVDYYYDDIFLLSINPDGKLHWSKVLYKKQYSQDDNAIFSSFFLFQNPTTLRFLFNDEIKTENTVSEYILSNTGQLERRSILNTQNLKLRLRFRDAVQVDFNEVIIPSERRNRLRLVKIEY